MLPTFPSAGAQPHTIEPYRQSIPRPRRVAQATAALQRIDHAASGTKLNYVFTIPFCRDDITEALAIGRCRTVRNIRLGNTGSANRRGALGDAIVDTQGLLPELLLLPFLRLAEGVERVAALLDVAPNDAPDFVANGREYDIKGIGLRRDGTGHATGCNINEKKRPAVFVVARIDYETLQLHCYAVNGQAVFSGCPEQNEPPWRLVTSGFSPYRDRTMPDAQLYRAKPVPDWLKALYVECALEFSTSSQTMAQAA
jgi:hypothetical protein